jgi:hypothetical protein
MRCRDLSSSRFLTFTGLIVPVAVSLFAAGANSIPASADQSTTVKTSSPKAISPVQPEEIADSIPPEVIADSVPPHATTSNNPATNNPTPNISATKESMSNSDLPLSGTALELAKDIDLLPHLERLEQLKHKYLELPGETNHIDVIAVRQEINEQLLTSLLENSAVISRLDNEIAQNDALADYMEGKRDTKIRYNNILNFSSGGIMQMFSSSLQSGTSNYNNLTNAGTEMEVVEGAVQTMISAYALKQQKGGHQSLTRRPNMLAPVIAKEPIDYSMYPPNVWRYLSDHPPDSNDSRRELLIKHWVKLGLIQALDKKGSYRETAALASTINLRQGVTISVLRTRIPMLEDIRAVVSATNQQLHEIMAFVRRR